MRLKISHKGTHAVLASCNKTETSLSPWGSLVFRVAILKFAITLNMHYQCSFGRSPFVVKKKGARNRDYADVFYVALTRLSFSLFINTVRFYAIETTTTKLHTEHQMIDQKYRTHQNEK